MRYTFWWRDGTGAKQHLDEGMDLIDGQET